MHNFSDISGVLADTSVNLCTKTVRKKKVVVACYHYVLLNIRCLLLLISHIPIVCNSDVKMDSDFYVLFLCISTYY